VLIADPALLQPVVKQRRNKNDRDGTRRLWRLEPHLDLLLPMVEADVELREEIPTQDRDGNGVLPNGNPKAQAVYFPYGNLWEIGIRDCKVGFGGAGVEWSGGPFNLLWVTRCDEVIGLRKPFGEKSAGRTRVQSRVERRGPRSCLRADSDGDQRERRPSGGRPQARERENVGAIRNAVVRRRQRRRAPVRGTRVRMTSCSKPRRRTSPSTSAKESPTTTTVPLRVATHLPPYLTVSNTRANPGGADRSSLTLRDPERFRTRLTIGQTRAIARYISRRGAPLLVAPGARVGAPQGPKSDNRTFGRLEGVHPPHRKSGKLTMAPTPSTASSRGACRTSPRSSCS
jgi:hypothetical protein